MRIGRVLGATRVLGESQGYFGLPVRDEVQNLGDLPHMLHMTADTVVDGPDTPVMVTVWFPSTDDIAALQAGAPIQVSLVGIAHPPISVGVGSVPTGPELEIFHCDRHGSFPGSWCHNCDPDHMPDRLTAELARKYGVLPEIAIDGEVIQHVTEYCISEGWVTVVDGFNGEAGEITTKTLYGTVTAKRLQT